jgi:hypothetical protein
MGRRLKIDLKYGKQLQYCQILFPTSKSLLPAATWLKHLHRRLFRSIRRMDAFVLLFLLMAFEIDNAR